MAESEVEQDTPLNISGQVLSHLRFADDINLLAWLTQGPMKISTPRMLRKPVVLWHGNHPEENDDHAIQHSWTDRRMH